MLPNVTLLTNDSYPIFQCDLFNLIHFFLQDKASSAELYVFEPLSMMAVKALG